MNPGRFLFELFYRIGYTPWEGHTLPAAVTDPSDPIAVYDLRRR
jgi:hypothetical protein